MVRPLVEVALDECTRHDVRRVRSMHLSIGEMVDVLDTYIPDLVRFLGRGTPLEGAEVVIERVPFYVRCRACGDIFGIDVRDEGTWHCPRCGGRDYGIFSGREFRLDSIEPAEEPVAV